MASRRASPDNAVMSFAAAADCPCQSGRTYARCCAPLHRHDAVADTAEALMRSRYSAYVLADDAYVLATWHARTRPASLALGEAASTRWLGLEVKRHAVHEADHATVEFVARYKVGGAAAVRLHEVSRFVREDGRWYYVDGEFPQR
jgi:SEC-C motif-containing protein